MSGTAQDWTGHTQARSVPLEGDEAEGNRRAQGWLIAIGASAALWMGIIVAVVGIAGLSQ
jgi:hypothetical protein